MPQSLNMPTNEFGQTVIGDTKKSNAPLAEVVQDQEGGLIYKAGLDFFDSPHLQKWAKENGVDEGLFESEAPAPSVEEEPAIIPPKLTATELHAIMNPDELTPVKLERVATVATEQRQLNKLVRAPSSNKVICVNDSCQYELPKEARFCSQCGTPQLGRHCMDCGFHFEGKEKFCPECGSQR